MSSLVSDKLMAFAAIHFGNTTFNHAVQIQDTFCYYVIYFFMGTARLLPNKIFKEPLGFLTAEVKSPRHTFLGPQDKICHGQS